MAQQVKVLAVKPDDLSSIWQTHISGKREDLSRIHLNSEMNSEFPIITKLQLK